MSSIMARALFFPSLAYNVIMEKVSTRQWYNWIDSDVILGALPLRYKTEEVQFYFLYKTMLPWFWNILIS